MWSKSVSLEIKDLRSRNDLEVKDEIVQLMTQAYTLKKEEEISSAPKRR